MKVYIDLDSGTILNGPIYEVHCTEVDVEIMQDSDETARQWAKAVGRKISD